MGMDRYMEEQMRMPQIIKELQAELAQLRSKYDELDQRYQKLGAESLTIGEKLQEFQVKSAALLGRAALDNHCLKQALQEIVDASRDEGLAHMCNWMRGRAIAALEEVADG